MKQADLTEPTSQRSLAEALAIRLGYIYPGAKVAVEDELVWLTMPNGRVFRIEVMEK